MSSEGEQSVKLVSSDNVEIVTGTHSLTHHPHHSTAH